MECKKTIILLMLTVFLLSITCVSASEIDKGIVSEDTNTIELSTDNDIIEDNLQKSEENNELTLTDTNILGADSATYSDLASEIEQLGNITLQHKTYSYDDGADEIIITEDNKVIDGDGAVIDMKGSTIRAFKVTASGVIIKNLTIKNANSSSAIYFESSGAVTNCNFDGNAASGSGGAVFFNSNGAVTNCNFDGNAASGSGGAVFFNSNGAVTNCTFTNNDATFGGAVIFVAKGNVINCNFANNNANNGGAVAFVGGDGAVINCTFTDNKAIADNSYGGAVSFAGGDGTVINCNFVNNNATYGGAINFYKKGNVTNCNFTNNYASDGGAVYGQSLTICSYVTNCNFNGNTASDTGGAVFLYNTDVSNCNFNGNTASSIGGAVYFYSDMCDVSNCNFINNSAGIDGGAIYFLNPGTVSNCNFTDNTAYRSGGAVLMNSGTVSNCNFTDNNASMGGAVYFLGGGYASNCNFINNNASIGGGIYFNGESDVIDCNFIDNYVSQRGGAVYLSNGGDVLNCNFTNNKVSDGSAVYLSNGGDVSNCNFGNNSADTDAGAIYLEGSGTVSNCNFTDNTANHWGGAVVMDSGIVSNCIFTNNNASVGGAVYFKGEGNVSNSNFINNNASIGGGIYFNGESNVVSCNFIDNYVSQRGGAVYLSNGGDVLNCNFTNNKASDGGAVYLSNGGDVSNCNFGNNSADTDAGAIYLEGSGIVSNCNFTDNTANHWGGAVVMDSGIVSNCIFTNNNASVGGAVYFKGEGNVSNSNFINNNASIGGGIYFNGESDVVSCNFIDNYVSQRGGAVYLSNGGNVTDSNFINNSAEFYAGALRLRGSGEVINCSFTNNEAGEYGGAIGITGGVINNSNFTGNDAQSGGAIFNSGNLTINNSNFKDNTAPDGSNNIILNGTAELILNNVTPEDLGPFYKGYMKVINVTNITYGDTAKITVNVTDAKSNPVNNGTVSVTIKGKEYSADVANGTATIEMDDVDAGTYNVNITYQGKYAVLAKNTTFNVFKANSSVVINPIMDVVYGNITFITFDVDNITEVDVIVYDEREIIVYKKFDYKESTLTIQDLPVGRYDVTITNKENKNYLGCFNSTVFHVIKANNTVKVEVNDVVYGTDVVVNVIAGVDGEYLINVNGTVKKVNVINGSGNVAFTLGAGSYWANATFNDGNYSSNITNATFIVFKANSSVIINPIEDLVYGNTTSVTFKVENITEVEVIVYDERGTIVFKKLIYRESPVTVPILPAGRCNVTITNKENKNYLGCVNSTVFYVIKANNTVKVEVNDVIYGAGVVVNVIAGVDGEYLINVNGTVKKVNVINGTGNVAFTLDVGCYWANATFDNGNYLSNITNATFNVFKANSSVIINPIENLVYGNTTFITFDVDNRTEVEVIVYDKMGLIVFEKHNYTEFNVTVPILPVGRYNVTITNNETENYLGCVNSTVFHVIKANNTVKVEVNDVVYGTDVVVNVIAGVDGEYLINVNGTVKKVNVINGKGNVTFTLGAGSYWANATFDNGNYSSNITNATFIVFKANSSVIINPIADLVYGNTTSVTFKVENITEVEVIVYDERGLIVFEKHDYTEFNVNVSILPAGRYNVTITNKETENYLGCVNSTVFHVIKANNTVKVEVNDVVYGTDVVVNVIAGVDGEYLINVNGTVKKVNVINGKGNAAFTLGAGSYWANATFDNGNYSSNITNATFNVFKANALITAINKAYVINYDGKYSVTLKDAEGRLISGQKVTFTLNGKDIGSAVSDANGIATITLTAKILKAAKAGKKNLIVKFSGTQNYNPISKTVKITVNKEKTKITAKKKTFKKSVKVKKYTIILKNSKGKAVKKVKVTLKIKGKTYKAKTNTKGKATFKIKKLTKKGIFKAKINFKATSLYLKSAKTVKIRIK